jgi:hypothetical protein
VKLTNFGNFIKELPCQNLGFDIKRQNWKVQSQQNNIDRIFNGADIITLNRFDLETASKNTTDYILKTLMWGYPTKGRGKNIDNLLSEHSLAKLTETLNDYRNKEITVNQLKTDIKNISGLGLSTMSKFTSFLNTTINSHKAVILDIQIINAINRGTFEEFNSLKKITYVNALNKYEDYISIIDELSHKTKAKPDQIENFIFLFGRSISDIKKAKT